MLNGQLHDSLHNGLHRPPPTARLHALPAQLSAPRVGGRSSTLSTRDPWEAWLGLRAA